MISEEFIRYNANTRNANAPDCVCRAISLAFDIPYNTIHKELLAEMHNQNETSYKRSSIYNKIIAKHGGGSIQKTDTINPETGEIEIPCNCTEKEFSDVANSGTYLVRSEDNAGKDRHLCCIINGDIYDSWDSSNHIVKEYYVIEPETNFSFDKSKFQDSATRQAKLEYMHDYMQEVFPDWRKQYPEITYFAQHLVSPNQFTFVDELEYQLNSKGKIYKHKVIVKLTPKTMSDDTFVQQVDAQFIKFEKTLALDIKNSHIDPEEKQLQQQEEAIKRFPQIPAHFAHAELYPDSLTMIQKHLLQDIYELSKGWYKVELYMLPGDDSYDTYINYKGEEVPNYHQFEVRGLSNVKNCINKYIKSNGRDLDY